MNLKQMVAIAIMLLLPFNVLAKQVNENEALRKAQVFLTARGMKQVEPAHLKMAMKGRKAKASSTDVSYYVFNVGQNEGFVIVSGDDRTAEIFGYSPQGNLNDTNIPDALRYLLDGYAEQIEWLNEHPEVQMTPYKAPARRAISPLIVSQWNQGAPYNNACPVYNSKSTVTGCVATSMAQVMYYNRWPIGETRAVPAFTSKSLKIAISALPATVFDWDAMTPVYDNNSTQEECDAVAKLMQYCGSSLEMDYGTSASSAYNASIPEVLKYYFGYDTECRYMQRYNYSYMEWVSMAYEELAQGRPLVLGGQSTGGGHSFVCDGYDTDDYFHINWGWGGSSDGYFRLSALNPYEQGIGGSSTLDGFTYSQDAVVGIKPGNSNENSMCVSLEKLQFTSSSTASQTVTRTSSTDPFTNIKLYLTICNYMPSTHSYDYAIQLTDEDGNLLNTLHEVDNMSMDFNKDYSSSFTNISTLSALTDGTYHIKVVSRATGCSTWRECYDGLPKQITAVVSGNTMTLTAQIFNASLPSVVKVNNQPCISVEGNLTVGYEQKVTVTVKGGASDYHDNMFLCYKVNNNVKRIVGKQVDIPAGQTVDVTFIFTPNNVGTQTLCIYAKSSELASINLDIADSDATTGIDLGYSYTLDNLTANNKLYGNAIRATVTITNPST